MASDCHWYRNEIKNENLIFEIFGIETKQNGLFQNFLKIKAEQTLMDEKISGSKQNKL